MGSRIRTRLATEFASRDELIACLDHLLAASAQRDLPVLDEKLYLDVFAQHDRPTQRPLSDEAAVEILDFLQVFTTDGLRKSIWAADSSILR